MYNREKLLLGEFDNDILTYEEQVSVCETAKLFTPNLSIADLDAALNQARQTKELNKRMKLRGYTVYQEICVLIK